MLTNKSAPVLVAGQVDITADAALIWDILAGVERWPDWHSDVKWARLEGEPKEGTEFVWRITGVTIKSRFLQLDRPGAMTWSGKVPGVNAVHSWQLDPIDGGVTRVSSEESWDSLLSRLLRWPLRRVLRAALEGFLRHLKAEAERRSKE